MFEICHHQMTMAQQYVCSFVHRMHIADAEPAQISACLESWKLKCTSWKGNKDI